MSFRTIAKLCFLVVIIGFFMPMACEQNGFQLANSELTSSGTSIALYVLFITAILGLVIGVLLFMKKGLPVIADWVVIAVCVGSGLIPFFANLGEMGEYYQSGVFVILVGYALIVVAQVISLVKKEK